MVALIVMRWMLVPTTTVMARELPPCRLIRRRAAPTLILAVSDENVEREEAGISTAEQQISELRLAFLVNADNLPIDYGQANSCNPALTTIPRCITGFEV
jgi:hypothetical protein